MAGVICASSAAQFGWAQLQSRVLAKVGETLPGPEGYEIRGIGPGAAINNQGHIAFYAWAIAPERPGVEPRIAGIWRFEDEIPVPVAITSEAAPGVPDFEFDRIRAEFDIWLNAAGDIAVLADLESTSGQKGEPTGLWVARDGALDLRLLDFTTPPELGGVLIAGTSRPSWNNRGDLLCDISATTDGPFTPHLWRCSRDAGSRGEFVIRAREALPGRPELILESFEAHAMNHVGEFVFSGLATRRSFVCAELDGALTTIAVSDDEIPDIPGSRFEAILTPDLAFNNRGEIALIALFDEQGPQSGIWLYSSRDSLGLRNVIRTGDDVPGMDGFVFSDLRTSAVLNAVGDLLFTARVYSSELEQATEVLALRKAQPTPHTRVIAKVGDEIPGGGEVAPGLVRAFLWMNAAGDAVLRYSSTVFAVSSAHQQLMGIQPETAESGDGSKSADPRSARGFASGLQDGQSSVLNDWGQFVLSVAPDGSEALTVYQIPTLACRGDADQSGSVDFKDISATMKNWQGFGPEGDSNRDGFVDFADITMTLRHWGSSCD